jgi:hypothetical protein
VRSCLARVRRPVVAVDSRDARLRQGDTRERRVVPLRFTKARQRQPTAKMQYTVQSRHTATRVSTIRCRPARMPTDTKPEAGHLDHSRQTWICIMYEYFHERMCIFMSACVRIYVNMQTNICASVCSLRARAHICTHIHGHVCMQYSYIDRRAGRKERRKRTTNHSEGGGQK